jgi:Ni,Fe-hydrogenase I cytochrome b subunit
MLYFRMILTMLVSLYTSRVVLNTLGVEDYGIYLFKTLISFSGWSLFGSAAQCELKAGYRHFVKYFLWSNGKRSNGNCQPSK